MQMSFKVSIIVPCYNQAQYLGYALQSILNQTHENWECIIVNDGATDNTKQIAEKWCAKDERFLYLEKKNGGLSSARNAGLNIANGDYIQFLDADDVLDSRKFEESLKKLKKVTNPSIVVTSFLMLNDKTNKLESSYCVLKQDLLTYNNILYKWDIEFTIPIHCGLFPTTISKKIGFEESLRGKEDWLFWIRITQQQVKILFLDQPLAYYRINPESISRSDSQMKNYHLQAFQLLSAHLDPKEYSSLIVSRLKFYINRLSDLTKEKQSLKNSNAYQTGMMLKKILRSFGLLKPGRKAFHFIRTFKKSDN